VDKKYKMYRKPNFFRTNFSFAGTMGRGEFWSEAAVKVISFLCASVITAIVVSVLVPGDIQYLSSVTELAVAILSVFWILAILAMTRRRLRDAGFSGKSYLWLLLPVIGWIIFVARLCAKSK